MKKDVIYIGNNAFDTLVAITEEEQQRGLMGKEWPPPVMCFPSKNAGIRKFWMKGTPSPLDIIFCYNNKIVDICRGEPLSTTLVGPNKPTDLVVEVPAGTASKFGFGLGDSVALSPTLETIAKEIKAISSKK